MKWFAWQCVCVCVRVERGVLVQFKSLFGRGVCSSFSLHHISNPPSICSSVLCLPGHPDNIDNALPVVYPRTPRFPSRNPTTACTGTPRGLFSRTHAVPCSPPYLSAQKPFRPFRDHHILGK